MKIFGEIKNVRYYNEDNGYTIASFLLSSESFSESIEFTLNFVYDKDAVPAQ